MDMINYNNLKPGTVFILDGQPYQVVEFSFVRMQQRKPVAQTKIKNLINGKVISRNFQHTESFQEAEIKYGGVKAVKIETGASINVPLFVEQGDIVRINTQTGEYVERVEKGAK